MKKSFFGTFGLLLLFQAALVHGQGFTGPGSNNNNRQNNRQARPVMASQPITVGEARGLPKDSWVILTGNIVNALPGGKLYTFRDSSGEITVEIDWKVWRGLSAGISDIVQISGEIEIERGQVLIEAKAISGANGGPGSSPPGGTPGGAVTITEPIAAAEARNLPNNSWVILSGNIVMALGKEYYTFRDSSNGEITVEIERSAWRGLSAGESDAVEIHGELKIKKELVYVKVKAIRKE